MTMRELITEVRKLVGEGYFSVQQEYTQHTTGNESITFRIYSGTSSWTEAANTKEEALELLKKILVSPPHSIPDKELEMEV